MDHLTIIVMAAAFVLFAFLSRRLETSIITAPIVFTAIGVTFGEAGFGLLDLHFDHEILDIAAEFTLLLVLFADASRVDFKKLRKDYGAASRMLVIGMPLVILLGTGIALLLPLGLSLWQAALLAAVLAPTDAALGQAVVTSPQVPEPLRRTLTVESGLNDGIALPLVLLFASLASLGGEVAMDRNWLLFTSGQLILGPLAGLVPGWLGAVIFNLSSERGWLAPSAEGAGAIGLAILAFLGAESIGGNGFIAAFVAGLTFGHCFKEESGFLNEFMEAEGQTLVLIVFAIFGASLLPEALPGFSVWTLVYALLSLTIIRMLPAFISLSGVGKTFGAKLFLSWFGPRGLASILFVVLLFDGMGMQTEETLVTTIYLTVALSILLHGVSAAPASKRFSAPERITANLAQPRDTSC